MTEYSTRRRGAPGAAIKCAQGTAGGGPASSAAGIKWNLEDLYRSPDDAAIASDTERAHRLAGEFSQKYRGRVAALSAAELAGALAEHEALTAGIIRPLIFSHLRFAADTATPAHGARLQAAREQYTLAHEKVIFFDLEWQALDEKRAGELLADPALEKYRHHLERVRVQAPYTLGEAEERILSVKDNTGRGAFQRLFDETVSAMRCDLGAGTPDGPRGEITLEQALSELYRPDRSR
ncbi:MAG: hypothetical protein OEZ59_00120, partial [Deltaproteobacteria bacterium]|nr:hypothetical protein [Deltaproteobacteria bacterium]